MKWRYSTQLSWEYSWQLETLSTQAGIVVMSTGVLGVDGVAVARENDDDDVVDDACDDFAVEDA